MPDRSAALLEPLSTFVLEVLPWSLSSLIALYLVWSLLLAPSATRAEPAGAPGAAAVAATLPASRPM